MRMELRSQIKKELAQLALEAASNDPIPLDGLDQGHQGEACHDQDRLRNTGKLPAARASPQRLNTIDAMPETNLNIRTSDEGPKQCPYCDRKFFRLVNFEAHMQTHKVVVKREVQHSEDEDLMEQSNESCASTSIQSHTTEPSQRRKQKSSRSRAKVRPTKTRNEERKCNFCQKLMSCKSKLRRHISEVHLKLKPYKCQYCDVAFTRPEEASRHESRHTGERPFKCDLCSSAFHDRSTLNKHRLLHSETATPYECCVCRAFFTSAQASAWHTHVCH